MGVAMALAAATLWGTTGTAQALSAAQSSPYWIGALRLAIASVFFAGFILLGRPKKSNVHFSLRSAWHWVLMGGIAMAAYNLFFFAGIKATGVATGTGVAIGSCPVWAGMLQSLVSRQPPRPIWWMGTALAVTGISLILWGAGADAQFDVIGLVFCLAAGLSYAFYTIVSKHLVSIASPEVTTFSVFTTAALIAVPIAAWNAGVFTASASTWIMVSYLGIVATGVSYLLFSHALRVVSVATCVTLTLAEPLTAFLLAIVLLGEQPGATAYGGLGFVLSGLLLVVWAETRLHRPKN